MKTLLLSLFFSASIAAGAVQSERSPWTPPVPHQQVRSSTVVSGNSGVRAGSAVQVFEGAASAPIFIQASNYVFIVPKIGSRRRPVSPVSPSPRAAHAAADPANRADRAGAIIEGADSPTVNYLESNPSPDLPNEEPAGEEPTPTPRVAPASIPIISSPVPLLPQPKGAAAPALPKEKIQPISEVKGPAFNDNDPLLGYQKQQAEKGDPQAQYALGIRYLTGNGVEENFILARHWLEKSSKNGNLKARAKLREL
jgi:hypothetical protein